MKDVVRRIEFELSRDLLAELAIDLYREGYRESSIDLQSLETCNYSCLTMRNYLWDLEKTGQILPNRMGKKVYKID